jgi:hypothetical protein
MVVRDESRSGLGKEITGAQTNLLFSNFRFSGLLSSPRHPRFLFFHFLGLVQSLAEYDLQLFQI